MTQDQESTAFDVFLSYNSKDKDEIKEIARQLKAKGLKPWLDEWEIRPGESWQDALEKYINQIHAAAVFVGKEGIGPWQRREMNAYLHKFVSYGSPVIPVLLKTASEEPALPLFLQELHYVDFRKAHQEFAPIDQLIWGITGKKPEPSPAHPATTTPGGNAPANPSVPANASITNSAEPALSFAQRSELVTRLLACQHVQDRHSRNTIVRQLPIEISRSISRSDVDIDDVTDIVSTCQNFANGLQTLIDIVAFFENGSLPMRRVKEFMGNLQ